MSSYVGLHIHSENSLLDGFGSPKRIAKRITELGMDGCAVTEHGNISSAVQFLKAMEKANKKPILGMEMYICSEDASKQCSENRKLLHLPVLAKNTTGWKQLLKIIHASNLPEHYYYKPRLSLDQLSEFLDGNIIGFSGHLGSHIAVAIEKYGEEEATKLALDMQEMFGKGNFYLEVQLMDHENTPEQIPLTETTRRISKATGIPLIATPDAHYQYKTDVENQRVLLCSNLHVTMKEANHPDFQLRTFFKSDNFHIPSYEEMVAYGHTEEELENTNKILEQIEKYDILQEPQLPVFPCPDNMNPDDYLRQLCREGWVKFVRGVIPKEKHQEYTDRVKRELEVLQGAELSSYFLIVRDILKFVEEKGYLRGCSRGSSGGCLVSYLIGVTQIDPIKYDLLFSRFYSDARRGSLPDIDIDIPINAREETIQYIKDKYGVDNVGQMITFQTMKGAKALKEVLRANESVPFEEMNRITKNIPQEAKIAGELQKMKDAGREPSIIRWVLENEPDKLKAWCQLKDDKLVGPLSKEFEQAITLEGTKSAQSRHAAGVVIGTKPLEEICPFILDTKNKNMIAGWEMDDLEAVGLVKIDILGLAALDKMMHVVYLRKRQGYNDFDGDITKLPLDDNKTWDLISEGNTLGCFQIESQLGISLSKKLKPREMRHLAALLTIMRPGSLNSFIPDANGKPKSVTEHYIDRKNHKEDIEFLHPALEPILKDTYALMIFQENAMRIATDIAGMSGQDTDKYIRKGIGKKLPELIAKAKGLFLEGCKKTKIVDEETAQQIFSGIEASQRYGFNASHSYGYGKTTYLTSYAKAHFPKEFFTAYLFYSKEKPSPHDEIYNLVNNAKSMDIFVQPPSMVHCNPNFDLIDGKIYFGLSDIKHVGQSMITKLAVLSNIKQGIIGTRNEWKWLGFLIHISPSINKRACQALINAGALDYFKMPRKRMMFEYGLFQELSKREVKWVVDNIHEFKLKLEDILINMASLPIGRTGACSNKNRHKKLLGLIESIQTPPYELVDKIHQIAQLEHQLMGISLTANSLHDCQGALKANCSCLEFDAGRRISATLAVKIERVKTHIIKRGLNIGQEMAFLTVSDNSGMLDTVVIFSDAWGEHSNIVEEGNRLLLTGKKSRDKDSFIVENVEQLS